MPGTTTCSIQMRYTQSRHQIYEILPLQDPSSRIRWNDGCILSAERRQSLSVWSTGDPLAESPHARLLPGSDVTALHAGRHARQRHGYVNNSCTFYMCHSRIHTHACSCTWTCVLTVKGQSNSWPKAECIAFSLERRCAKLISNCSARRVAVVFFALFILLYDAWIGSFRLSRFHMGEYRLTSAIRGFCPLAFIF